MAKDFFDDIGEMGLLGELLGGMVSGIAGSGLVPENTPEGKVFTSQSELFKLKKQEAVLLLEVGKQAYDKDPSAFPQDEKLKLIHENMAELQAIIDAANKEQSQNEDSEENKAKSSSGKKEKSQAQKEADAAYVAAVSKFDTPDTRICKNCETRIRDPKMTSCFYCGESLEVTENSDESTDGSYIGKYYMTSFVAPEGMSEEEFQQAQQFLDAFATSAGVNSWELNTVEFFEGNKAMVKLMFDGKIKECTYTLNGNTISVIDDEGDEVLNLLIDGDVLVSEKEDFEGKMIYTKTTPVK